MKVKLNGKLQLLENQSTHSILHSRLCPGTGIDIDEESIPSEGA
jgi:hypothetical protein